MRVKGRLEIEVRRATDGALLERSIRDNVITDNGLDLMAGYLGGNTDFVTHMAVGTGSSGPTASDTVLDTEVFRNAIARRVPTAKRLRLQMFLGTGDANGFTLSEAGIFNASSGGTMFSRVVISPAIVKTVSITVTMSWIYDFIEG